MSSLEGNDFCFFGCFFSKKTTHISNRVLILVSIFFLLSSFKFKNVPRLRIIIVIRNLPNFLDCFESQLILDCSNNNEIDYGISYTHRVRRFS